MALRNQITFFSISFRLTRGTTYQFYVNPFLSTVYKLTEACGALCVRFRKLRPNEIASSVDRGRHRSSRWRNDLRALTRSNLRAGTWFPFKLCD